MMRELRKKFARVGVAATGLMISASAFAGICPPEECVQVSEPGTMYLFALALAGVAIVRKLRK